MSAAVLAEPRRRARRLVLAGNPNVGKSTLFNRLTGLHQKVTNFPGSTVERKSGLAELPGGPAEVVDLPGAYGLSPRSPEERVVRDAVRGADAEDAPDLVVLVLDAANLARNLFFATQVLDTGIPAVVALNQVDQARAAGVEVDAAGLAAALGVPVVPVVGRTGEGVEALRAALAAGGARALPADHRWHPAAVAAAGALAGPLGPHLGGEAEARRRLPEILGSEGLFAETVASLPPDLADLAARERARLPAAGADAATASAETRWREVERLAAACVRAPGSARAAQDRVDRVLTHPVAGSLVLLALALLLFQALFAWSEPLVGAIEDGFSWLGALAASHLPGGLFLDFLRGGLLAGFAGVVVFVPQIAMVFLFLEVLDDSGYLARAAFLLDRLMAKAGLPGRAFLPIASSFACAIPGVMATRTIQDRRDRLATIAAAPFMSCSARLPVYFMVTGALFREGTVLGLVSTAAVVMISMYLLGLAAGLLTARLLRSTVLKGGRSPLLLELPPYRMPSPRSVLFEVVRRTWLFVARAGPVIVVLSVVLWVLMTFPRDPALARDYDAEARAAEATAAARPDAAAAEAWLSGERARLDRERAAEAQSLTWGGRLGNAVEPVFRPLGFDGKMGIGILASFAAREVFVSTMSVVYAASGDPEEDQAGLHEAMLAERDPRTGRPVYRPLVGISLLVFFVLAMQCVSTLAVVKRETGGWAWPAGLAAWMTLLAYGASLAVYQVGSALGY